MDETLRLRRRARNLSSLFNCSSKGGGRVEPVALSEPFQSVFERLLVGHLRGHPPVASDISSNADIRKVQRNFTLFGCELDRERQRIFSDRHSRKHLVVANLENRMSPRRILIRLRERECKLANALSVRHV